MLFDTSRTAIGYQMAFTNMYLLYNLINIAWLIYALAKFFLASCTKSCLLWLIEVGIINDGILVVPSALKDKSKSQMWVYNFDHLAWFNYWFSQIQNRPSYCPTFINIKFQLTFKLFNLWGSKIGKNGLYFPTCKLYLKSSINRSHMSRLAYLFDRR